MKMIFATAVMTALLVIGATLMLHEERKIELRAEICDAYPEVRECVSPISFTSTWPLRTQTT